MQLFPTSRASTSSRTTRGCPSCATRASASALSIVSMALRWRCSSRSGLNYGVDFKGGSLIEVQSNAGPADMAHMRSKLNKLGVGDVQIQSFGGRHRRADPRRAAAGRRGRAAGRP